MLGPLKINVSPDAPALSIAKACRSRLIIAHAKGASLAVLVLDRETQSASPGDIASAIATELVLSRPPLDVSVVIKDRMFENWLVADLDALEAQPGRFKVTPAIRRAVEPNKADGCDALSLLKRAVVGTQYDKVSDASRILKRADVSRSAANSRSFRHFLHALGDKYYSKQCKKP